MLRPPLACVLAPLRLCVIAGCLIAPIAAAQTAVDPLRTWRGWEAGLQASQYHYEEPGFMKIIGARGGIEGAYAYGRGELFIRADARISYGSLRYQGSGTQDNVPDTIWETRVIVGRDFRAGDDVSFSPYAGLGYRYLYDDLRGYSSCGNGATCAGYRRYSNYLYAPLGSNFRVRLTDRWVLAPAIEYDIFLRGEQMSMLSDVGSNYTDVTNIQKKGYGYRIALMVEYRRFVFGPWLHYWNIGDSDTRPCGTFNGSAIVCREPANWTREAGIEARYRF